MATRSPTSPGTYQVYGDAVPDILASARRHNVDPWVALALASSEGGFNYGAVGDNNSSYGPYQLHVGGALPAGETAAWANSPAGIDYAIRQIASVVGTRTGRQGIAYGVTRFERPSDIPAEITKDDNWLAAQLKKAGGRDPSGSASAGYHPITSAQEALQGGLTDVVPGLDTLTKGISSWVSGIEGFVLRGGKVILGVLLILAVMFLAIRT